MVELPGYPSNLQGDTGMMARLALVTLLSAAVVWSAPLEEQKRVQKEETSVAQGKLIHDVAQPEVSLLRVKRAAETIIYGNHQNTERVKKAGPIPPLPPVDHQRSQLDQASKTGVSLMEEDTLGMESRPEAQKTVHTMVAPVKADKTEDEEEELEQLTGLFTASGDPNQTQDYKEMPVVSEKGANQIFDYNRAYEEGSSKIMGDDYNPYYDYFYGVYQGRRKRSAPKEHQSAVQAEDMGTLDLPSNRIKRDLPDNYFEGDYENYFEDYPSDRDENVKISDSALASAYLEALLEQGQPNVDYPEEERMVNDDYKAAVAAALEEEQAEEAEEESARERLLMLEYMYQQQAAEEEERQRNQAVLENEFGKRSSWAGLGPAQEAEYEEIVHNGQLGVFFPVKRQYLSMVPGVRKRSFYPYTLGPDGRWGALVHSQVEKRNQEEMYERLYRLASALRAEEYAQE